MWDMHGCHRWQGCSRLLPSLVRYMCSISFSSWKFYITQLNQFTLYDWWIFERLDVVLAMFVDASFDGRLELLSLFSVEKERSSSRRAKVRVLDWKLDFFSLSLDLGISDGLRPNVGTCLMWYYLECRKLDISSGKDRFEVPKNGNLDGRLEFLRLSVHFGVPQVCDD